MAGSSHELNLSSRERLATGGRTQINPAVTGFRLVSISGLVTANVTAKAFHTS